MGLEDIRSLQQTETTNAIYGQACHSVFWDVYKV